MPSTEPAALASPVLLAPSALDGALADRLLERAVARLAGTPGGEGNTNNDRRGGGEQRAAGRAGPSGSATSPAGGAGASGATRATSSPAAPPVIENALSEGEQAMLAALRARDSEVRAHEEAHARVGGRYAGEPSYTYQQGPDGGRYAIGGSVSIDVAPVEGDPEATIAKMAIVRAAALAPAEPSSSDRRIAAIAEAETRRAVAELARTPQGGQAPESGSPAPPSVDGDTRETLERGMIEGATTRFLDSLRSLLDAVQGYRAIDRSA
ncbi:MAG: putative metalloprotease CJM1_0395 family protein [Pseudomonadota bacterium]